MYKVMGRISCTDAVPVEMARFHFKWMARLWAWWLQKGASWTTIFVEKCHDWE